MRALTVIAAVAATPTVAAADLQPKTVRAFEAYVRATEQRMDGANDPFILVDGLPEPRRMLALDALRRGEFVIEPVKTRDGNREIDIPDGLVHHWAGVVFVPGGTVDEALALLQDYDRHAQVYAPNVARSRVIGRDGERFTVFLRFSMKKVITVVVNSEHEARFTRHGPERASSRIYSTRVAEVENPGTPEEREKPVGRDGGYLWRLNSYWRFLEQDGGVYIQSESITLTRGIPFGFGWMIKPFVTSIPRETLTFTLEATRKALTSAGRG
jgi:hypothetical protein